MTTRTRRTPTKLKRTLAATTYVRLGGAVAIPVRRFSAVVALAFLVLLAAATVATLSIGEIGIPVENLAQVVTGAGEGTDPFVWDQLRGPRLIVGIGAGAALGLSGALFQSVTRNPLGSPDVIGMVPGAGAGAAIVALQFPDTVPASVGALLGAVLAMGLVYLSTGTGFRNPARLVVAGIGVAAIGTAVIQSIVYAVERDKATVLTAYINGSLASRSWSDASTIWLVLLVVGPLAVLLAPRLHITEMGDELADGLGAGPRRAKTFAVVLSVAFTAAAVSVAGPVAFISLTAPHIAKRTTRGTGPHLLLSAAVGALLLVLADLCSQQLTLFERLPVGIYTMAIGGAYLGYLLIREWRRGKL